MFFYIYFIKKPIRNYLVSAYFFYSTEFKRSGKLVSSKVNKSPYNTISANHRLDQGFARSKIFCPQNKHHATSGKNFKKVKLRRLRPFFIITRAHKSAHGMRIKIAFFMKAFAVYQAFCQIRGGRVNIKGP